MPSGHAEPNRPDHPGQIRRDGVAEPAAPALGLAAGEEWVLRRVRRHGIGPVAAGLTLLTILGALVVVVIALLVVDGFADRSYWATALVFAVVTPTLVAPPIMLVSARLVAHLDTATRLLQESVVTDPLTGVANRRGFFAALGSIGHGGELEVGMVDVDDFKSINDERGHPAGDTALCMVAAWLEELVGDDGTVGRLGGDEFAFVTAVGPDRPIPSRMDFRLDGTSFTVSIGTARARDGDVHEALSLADAELYRHKQARPVPPRRIVRSDQRGGDE